MSRRMTLHRNLAPVDCGDRKTGRLRACPKSLGALLAAVMLAVATSASAECAWVLWSEVNNTYRAMDAFSERDINGAQAACGRWAQKYREDPRYNKGESRYICLPDTVDPRGPKGK